MELSYSPDRPRFRKVSDERIVLYPGAPGPGAPAARLAEMLRVDHAGELAAVHIYRGQRAVLNRAPGKDRIAFQLQEMEAHEAEHLAAFNQLLTERQVRPTLISSACCGGPPGLRWGPRRR